MKSIIAPNWFSLLCNHDDTKKKKKREDGEKTQSSTNLYSNQHICRVNKKRTPLSQCSNRLKLPCLFFLSWNVTDYHETRKLNSFFFFHLSNNWFDISEHFKGSLAWRLCSKLQYKAEDLPLAQCQVYARFPYSSQYVFPHHILFGPSFSS